ncbi:hypothetical protein DMA15_27695 [Streptomyces sp. WAC 01529]|uniref:hypothetical protein n=1 Tax=Streptomyces sp. WAC 01529 TaxID=2203205 RepID=UPI000F6FE504|nr:hypothetical protein [Streptomyces sp. WAC 01529]AZM57934.1 hypothetical protein DMA15_27695 [Streptomyces sp. WAC 01529]
MRWVPAFAIGALWWWGVLRLAFAPDAGALEGAVAAGGWGLSLLPVHCVPQARAVGASRASRAPGASKARGGGAWRAWITKAWRLRRSGGGSDPS